MPQHTAAQKPSAGKNKPGFFEKLTNWELWPAAALYAPLAPFWAWYALRARSFWFFTPSNPTIPFGGYEGETKTGVYAQLPTDCYPRTILAKPSEDFEALKKRIAEAGFTYPFVVKPDVGRKGLLFRTRYSCISCISADGFYYQDITVTCSVCGGSGYFAVR